MSWFHDRDAGRSAVTLDPYGTLGIAPGASAAEIKRAYRRLVKEHHPDSGGPAELPRFLAIQAAYEMLVSGRAPGPGFSYGAGPGRPGDGTGPGAAGATGSGPAWRADPARARATRDAWRRARGWSTDDAGGAGTAGGPGAPGGARGADGARGAGGAGTTAGAAATAGSSGRASADGGGRGARGTAGGDNGHGSAGGDNGHGSAGGPGGGGERHREGARHGRGSRRKATPGSTTYDEAHHEPGEPGWTGSSWYGQTSGTYWTINPREYADPRKHGPEYLARARKAAQPGGAAADDGEPPGSTDAAGTREPPRTYARRGTSMRHAPAATPGASMSGTSTPRPGRDSAPREPGDGARPDTAAQGGIDDDVGADEPPQAAAGRRAPEDGGAAAPSRASAAEGTTAAGDSSPASGTATLPGERPVHGPEAAWTPGDRRPTGRPQPGPRSAGQVAGAVHAADPAFGPPVDLAGAVGGILRAPARSRTRLVLALAGWPPLGVAATLLLGEISGCARFAASCASASSFAGGVLAAQAIILALLLAVPPVARLAAVGGLATVVAALPAMAFLTAIGASYSPQGGPASLLALLGLAWLAGVLLAWRFRQTSHGLGEGSPGRAP